MSTRPQAVSSSHLRRSKSSTSVQDRKRHPRIADPIDPAQAKTHALIAAHRAMNRSSGAAPDDRPQTQTASSRARGVHSSAVSLQPRRSSLLPRSAERASFLPPTLLSSTDMGDLPPYTEAGLLPDSGESYGAEPSSYRKLRKAKSMLEPAKKWRQAHSLGSHSPITVCRTLRHTTSHNDLDGLGLKVRLKKSISILKRRNMSSPTRTSIVEKPRPVEVTRSSFLQARTLPQISKKASAFFNPKLRRIRNEFRATLHPSEYVSPDLQLRPPPKAFERARSMSNSLRKKFMRAVSKTGAILPPQHLGTSRAHFRETPSRSDVDEGFDSYDGTLFEGRNPYIFTTHSPRRGDIQEQRNATVAVVQVSQENLEDGSGSRVTSWTNSTNTGSLREAMSERKRLSVIKEDGSPHQPSSSAGTHFGGVPVVRRPLPSQQDHASDSQRLYSALVKRINQESDDNARLQTIEDDEDGERSSDFGTPATVVRRSKSQDTVRSVGPANEYREFSIGNPWQECSTLAPDRVKENMNRRKEKLKLQEQQTSFFPHTIADQPETESPFRQHLHARRTNCATKSLEDLAIEISGPRLTPGWSGHVIKNPKYIFSSESFYSQTTNGDEASRHDIHMGSKQRAGGRKIDITSEGQVKADVPEGKTSIASMCDYSRETIQLSPTTQQIDKYSRTLHTREYAQTDASLDDKAPTSEQGPTTESVTKREDRRKDRDFSSNESINVQLLVAKNRAPSCGNQRTLQSQTTDEHEDRNLTRKQSSVLQRITNGTRPVGRDESKLVTSNRKASPMDLVRRLRSKTSMPAVLTHPDAKENRPDTSPTRNSDEPASTPGPYYLASRDRNSPSQHRSKQRSPFDPRPAADRRSLKEESPTDRFKAGLSARLSKPFDMDTPNLNRPFDSIYLGKREGGFADSTNGRLSTRHIVGSYGGLGPNPLVAPDKTGGGTALPHFPTPEADERAKHSSRPGRSFGSKRIVSNFLRSRRRAGRDKDDNDCNGGQSRTITAPRWDSEERDEVEHRTSPLFV